MSDADELGDFFAEIKEIEATVAESTMVSVPVTVAPAPVYAEALPPVAYVPQVIMKAPEIVRTSHPVYTYDQPGLSDINVENTDEHGNNAGYQLAPMLPASFPVPPPQVPRSKKVFVRHAAESTWVDDSLQEWPENDYRIFVGDLAKEVTTENLAKMFQQYKSYAKAKVSVKCVLLLFCPWGSLVEDLPLPT